MLRLKESVFLPSMEALKQQPDSLSENRDSTGVDSLKTDTVARFENSIKHPSAEKKTEIEAPILPNFFHTEFNSPIAPKSRHADADSWILPLLLLFFFCIALINLAFPRSLLQIVTAVFRLDGIRKIQSDENAVMRKAMRLMHLVYVFLFPIFAYQVLKFGQINVETFSAIPLYWKLLLLSGGLLAGKISLVSIVGYLFNCIEESTTYRHGILVMNCLLVLVLIPICLSLKISPPAWTYYLIVTGSAFFALFYLISLAIGALSGSRSKTLSKFHLILYFCALEAIPVFLILKIAKAFI
jgi:hypothetical protein